MAAIYLLCLGPGTGVSEPSAFLRLSFVGDIMAHDNNHLVRDYQRIYHDLADRLQRDDLTFANLEFPVSPDHPVSGYPRFNVHTDYLEAALASGIDVLSLANNHTTDLGLAGVRETLTQLGNLRSAGTAVHFNGARVDPTQPVRATTINHKGWKISFLAVTQFLNQPQAAHYVHHADYRRPQHAQWLLTSVAELAQTSDLLIVSYHGGVEYVTTPDPAKAEFFRALASAGADIVFGHHPHVLQPVEVVRVSGQDRLVIHSAGNLISAMTYSLQPGQGQHSRAMTGDAALIQVDLTATTAGRRLTQVKLVPISNYRTRDGQMVIGELSWLARRDATWPWATYYRQRHLEVVGFLSGFAVAPVAVVGAAESIRVASR